MPLIAQDEVKIQSEKPTLELHGALRFNYKLASWKEGQKNRGGDFGYDMFALSPKAYYKGLTLDVEYRLYASDYGGGLLRRGDISYDFNDKNKIMVGLTRVPFGIESTLYIKLKIWSINWRFLKIQKTFYLEITVLFQIKDILMMSLVSTAKSIS